MSYFIIEETLGYTIGLSDDGNPVPKGAKTFNSEKELEAAIKSQEDRVSKEFESFGDPFVEVREKLNSLKVKDLREILDKAKIDYKGLNKSALIDLIIENNLV